LHDLLSATPVTRHNTHNAIGPAHNCPDILLSGRQAAGGSARNPCGYQERRKSLLAIRFASIKPNAWTYRASAQRAADLTAAGQLTERHEARSHLRTVPRPDFR
jgi:hypothetical protein